MCFQRQLSSSKACIDGILLLLPVISHAENRSSGDTIVLTGSIDTRVSVHGRWLILIYNEVFKRLGYTLEYRAYPSARSSAFSNEGSVDGEINRVFEYLEGHPHMIRVTEPHFSTKISAFVTSPDTSLKGWKSLKNSEYKVEYRRGTWIAKNRLESIVAPHNLSTIALASQGVSKLIKNRTDIYIDSEIFVYRYLYKLSATTQNLPPVYKAGVMTESSLHVYLNKKHADLAPRISSVLRTIKKEGLIEKFKKQALASDA